MPWQNALPRKQECNGERNLTSQARADDPAGSAGKLLLPHTSASEKHCRVRVNTQGRETKQKLGQSEGDRAVLAG